MLCNRQQYHLYEHYNVHEGDGSYIEMDSWRLTQEQKNNPVYFIISHFWPDEKPDT